MDVKSKENDKSRLKEIIEILNKHHLLTGISPKKLREIMEDLGPTFIKLGQILSMRNDILPVSYCQELSKLRSDVSPMCFSEIQTLIEDSFGNPLFQLFSSFDQTPLGSASIAQVHRAKLLDGTAVVVKIQRPGIYETMAKDISLLKKATGILGYLSKAGDVINFDMVLTELWATAQEEMNFLVEAGNAEEFSQMNHDISYVACPKIIKSMTTSNVLVMEYIEGRSLSDTKALQNLGYDLHEIGLKLSENYIKQIIDDGFFHADPHPGNILIREGKIVWLDLGMMGKLSLRDQKNLSSAIEALSRRDIGKLKDVVLTMGICHAKIDHAALYTDIDDFLTKFGSEEIASIDLAVFIEEFLSIARRHHISFPKGLSMLGRGIITLQGTLATLSTSTNLVELMALHLSQNPLKYFNWKTFLLNSSLSIFQSSQKLLDMPSLLSDLLKTLLKGQGKICMDLQISESFTKTADRLVNKLFIGLLVAALLIASSLVCTTNMQPKLLDIPAVGVLGYLIAFGLCIHLIITNKINK